MKQKLIRNTSNIGFALASIIMLSAGVYVVVNLLTLINRNQMVSHTLIVLNKLDETLALLTDAETAQRGYIITGDEKFLEPYNAALSSSDGIHQHLQELRQLTSDDPNQQQRLDSLDSLVAQKLAFIQNVIDLRKNTGFESAQEAISTNIGKQTMDDIRRLLADMKNEESELLQQRSVAATNSLQNTILAMTIGAGLSLSLLLFSFIIVNREVGIRKRAEEALRQINSELDQRVEQRTAELAKASERYRSTLDNMLEGCQIIGFDWCYLYINAAAEKHNRRPNEELLGKIYMDMWAGIENTEVFKLIRGCLEERISHQMENEFVFPDGTNGWFELRIQPVPEGIFILSQNITERKRAEMEILHRLQNIQALQKIDQAIAGSLDLKLTLNVVLEQTKTELKIDAATVLLFNPHTQVLEFAAGIGFRSKAFERSRLRLGEGHGGRAALERRTVTVTNLLDAERSDQFVRAPLLADEGFITYFGTPLIAKGQVRGVLEVFHRSPFIPNQDWLDFLEVLAGQTAIAVDSASLFTDLQHANTELFNAYDSTIEGWSHALDLRDKETEGHTLRVTEMTMKLARAAGITEEELVHVRRGALLHDIGKMGVPDHILLKPDKLTDEEWVAMRKHPTFAFELLSPIAYLRPALDIPYYHHEKWDGSGYPRGLKGEQIPLAARLFAIVDVWDALLSDRPYRQGWSKEKVVEHIKSLSGTHFDPKAVELFLKVINEDEKGAG